ncbi:uncharacterized protein VTP21DRAFT_11010 [Calcarisporiella thermophila]|uniref:uncharacterized protein n=1 Tax=Calcarisporiella thermophila TaxID=911321 RepID=UPI0037436E29
MGQCCSEEDIDFSEEVELNHFHLLRSVGKGSFGKVRVVQHKQTKNLYALKYINKIACIKMRAAENILSERRLLECIDFPLIVNLHYAFQDDENLFMVLDLMLGGDLRFHLNRQGSLREEVVRFYAAEISLSLDYLHSKQIVHRDLKPDNILLDQKGHAHLTDFNIATHYSKSVPLTSLAGSVAYMAPEILLRKGYFYTVDWWSLGIVLYELLFGRRPFKGKTTHALKMSILTEPLKFPDNAETMVSPECIDFIRRLCERDITQRMGCGPDRMEELKRHKWFEGVEWAKLEKKEILPPFEPDSKRANFDATHELEELLLEENPLRVRKRVVQHDPNSSRPRLFGSSYDQEYAKELQMFEERFMVYDASRVDEAERKRKRSYAALYSQKELVTDVVEMKESAQWFPPANALVPVPPKTNEAAPDEPVGMIAVDARLHPKQRDGSMSANRGRKLEELHNAPDHGPFFSFDDDDEDGAEEDPPRFISSIHDDGVERSVYAIPYTPNPNHSAPASTTAVQDFPHSALTRLNTQQPSPTKPANRPNGRRNSPAHYGEDEQPLIQKVASTPGLRTTTHSAG